MNLSTNPAFQGSFKQYTPAANGARLGTATTPSQDNNLAKDLTKLLTEKDHLITGHDNGKYCGYTLKYGDELVIKTDAKKGSEIKELSIDINTKKATLPAILDRIALSNLCRPQLDGSKTNWTMRITQFSNEKRDELRTLIGDTIKRIEKSAEDTISLFDPSMQK